MQERFNSANISSIIDQALVYQCACPAQVCRTILEMRELYEYQRSCGNDSANDRKVHDTIAEATACSHALMEQCLTEILALEGWDMETLTMPESLRRKPTKAI